MFTVERSEMMAPDNETDKNSTDWLPQQNTETPVTLKSFSYVDLTSAAIIGASVISVVILLFAILVILLFFIKHNPRSNSLDGSQKVENFQSESVKIPSCPSTPVDQTNEVKLLIFFKLN